MKINRFKAVVLGLTTLVGGAVCANAQTNNAGEVDLTFPFIQNNNAPTAIITVQSLPTFDDNGVLATLTGAYASFGITFAGSALNYDGNGKITGVTLATVTATDASGNTITAPEVVNVTGSLTDKGTTPQVMLSLSGKGIAETTDANGNTVGAKSSLSLKFTGTLSSSSTGPTTYTTNFGTLVTNFTAVTNVSELTNTGVVFVTNTTPNITTVTNSTGTNYVATGSNGAITNGTPYFMVLTSTNGGVTNTIYVPLSSATGATFTSTNFVTVSNPVPASAALTNLYFVDNTNYSEGGTNSSGVFTNVTTTLTPVINFYGTNLFALTTTVINLYTNSASATNTSGSVTNAYTNENFVAVSSGSGVSTNATAYTSTTTTNYSYSYFVSTNAPVTVTTTNYITGGVTNTLPYFIEAATTNCGAAAGTIICSITTNSGTSGAGISGIWTGSWSPGIKKAKPFNLPKTTVVGSFASGEWTGGNEVDVNASILILTGHNSAGLNVIGTIAPTDLLTGGGSTPSIPATGSGSGKGNGRTGTASYNFNLVGAGQAKGSSLAVKGNLTGDPLGGDVTVFTTATATGKLAGQKVNATAASGTISAGSPFGGVF